MTKKSFDEELRKIDRSLFTRFNDYSGFWEICRTRKRKITAALDNKSKISWLEPIDEVVMTVMNTMQKRPGTNRYAYKPLDMRTIWALALGDTRNPDFEARQKKIDAGLLIDQKTGDVLQEAVA